MNQLISRAPQNRIETLLPTTAAEQTKYTLKKDKRYLGKNYHTHTCTPSYIRHATILYCTWSLIIAQITPVFVIIIAQVQCTMKVGIISLDHSNGIKAVFQPTPHQPLLRRLTGWGGRTCESPAVNVVTSSRLLIPASPSYSILASQRRCSYYKSGVASIIVRPFTRMLLHCARWVRRHLL